jgi:O-antigen ligase
MRTIAFWLSLLLIFIIPWENSVILPGLGRISRVVGLGVGLFWLGTVVINGRIRQPRPFHLLCLLYFFWHGFTLLWSVDPNTTLSRIVTYAQLAVLIFMIWDLFLTRAHLLAGLQAYVLGASISALDTIGNYLAGISRGATPRYTATGFNPNGLAMMLVLALPVAWYLAVAYNASDGRKQHILKIINYTFIPVAIFAILLTGSRTVLFSLLPFFWFVLSTSNRLRPFPRIVVALGLMGAFYFIQPLVPQTSIERLSTTRTELLEGGDLSGRRLIWEQGLSEFEDNSLIGAGSGAFKRAVAFKDKSAHNLYVTLLVEVGLVGLVLFGLVVGTAVYHIRYLPRWEAIFWLAIILSWLIGNFTMSWELKKDTWLFLSLIVVSANLRLPVTVPTSLTPDPTGALKPVRS